jgi:hypothetical protein
MTKETKFKITTILTAINLLGIIFNIWLIYKAHESTHPDHCDPLCAYGTVHCQPVVCK